MPLSDWQAWARFSLWFRRCWARDPAVTLSCVVGIVGLTLPMLIHVEHEDRVRERMRREAIRP